MPSGGTCRSGRKNGNRFSSGTVSARPIGVNAPMISPQAAAAASQAAHCELLSTAQRVAPAAGVAQIAVLENPTSPEDSDGIGQNDTLNSAITRRFLQLDCKAFERLGRYETALWRQVYQVIFVLNVLRRQNLDRSWLPRSASSTRFRFRPSGSLLPKA
jgi:hypothetical protein